MLAAVRGPDRQDVEDGFRPGRVAFRVLHDLDVLHQVQQFRVAQDVVFEVRGLDRAEPEGACNDEGNAVVGGLSCFRAPASRVARHDAFAALECPDVDMGDVAHVGDAQHLPCLYRAFDRCLGDEARRESLEARLHEPERTVVAVFLRQWFKFDGGASHSCEEPVRTGEHLRWARHPALG